VNSALTVLQHQVLTALAEGYAARQGMKDRIRALNEWEIARRSGLTQASYAEYQTHPTREDVSAALSVLQRMGFASVWDHGAKYDTYIPTASGTELVAGAGEFRASVPGLSTGEGEQPVGSPAGEAPASDAVIERLDEVVRLLRSIDAKLEGR
jgi:hypothetical protein